MTISNQNLEVVLVPCANWYGVGDERKSLPQLPARAEVIILDKRQEKQNDES